MENNEKEIQNAEENIQNQAENPDAGFVTEEDVQKSQQTSVYTPEVSTPQFSKKGKVKRTRPVRIIAVLCAILVVLSVFFGGFLLASFTQSEDAALADWLVDTLNSYAYYANYEGLDAAFLLENGLSFCLWNDPYCNLMTPEETLAYYASASGSSTSFGITVSQVEGYGVIIYSVVSGSSADENGIEQGMRILSIDGEDFYDATLDDVSAVLLGKEEYDSVTMEFLLPIFDETGNFGYSRDGEVFTATIQKTEYTPIVVEYFDNQTAGLEALDDQTAYIAISSFVGKTAEQFDEAMAWFASTGKTKLILDLRDNGGGSEQNMQAVGSYLLEDDDETTSNPVIITIQDKYGNVQEIRTDDNYYSDMGFEYIIVLTNSATASASEAILTAMIDYETVDLIIGETTYGKGTGLMTVYMPIYGYSVTFTSSIYYSPYGNFHDGVGLSPTNGYYVVDTISFPYDYSSDEILQRAINALR